MLESPPQVSGLQHLDGGRTETSPNCREYRTRASTSRGTNRRGVHCFHYEDRIMPGELRAEDVAARRGRKSGIPERKWRRAHPCETRWGAPRTACRAGRIHSGRFHPVSAGRNRCHRRCGKMSDRWAGRRSPYGGSTSREFGNRTNWMRSRIGPPEVRGKRTIGAVRGMQPRWGVPRESYLFFPASVGTTLYHAERFIVDEKETSATKLSNPGRCLIGLFPMLLVRMVSRLNYLRVRN